MGKYLYTVSYTPEGLKGLILQGGSARVAAITRLVTEMGGTLDAFYFAFGTDDVFVIADMPDNESSIAFVLAVNAAGAATIKTTVLIAAEEVDRATKVCVNYLPPGTLTEG